MSAPAYEISGVEHAYNGQASLRCQRLDVPEGAVVGIGGPNGAGKSTLMRVMAFLLAPSRGSVRFFGREARCGDPALIGQAVLMPQDPALLRRRVEANVLYGLKLRGMDDPRAAAEALELVGLDPGKFMRRWWWELSGGEARRVALAARLAIKPRVLLLDEPTASLDPESAELVRLAVLAARRARGLTALAVSHDREWLDAACDVTYRLDPVTGIELIDRKEPQCAP
jgi:tungstate transport system ATP-binding protein